MKVDDPEVTKIRDDIYCAMFEQVIDDKMIINYSQSVVGTESKLSVRSVTPYTKTQVNFLNGNQFFGDINDCRLSGNGRYLWADDGSLYEGEFQRPNIIEGRGTFKYQVESSGSTKYCGSFVDGKYHGKGQLTNFFFKYIGSFECNQFHGRGCLKSGIDSFDGLFSKDKKVSGKRVYTNGIFDGDFHDDETRKCGEYKFENGDVYRGSFENGMLAGFGEYTWSSENANGMKYLGYWRHNHRDGLGMLKASDTSCVTLFRKNVKDGAGVVLATNRKVYASKKMFQRDEFVQCVEVEITRKNIDVLRRIFNPSELQAGSFNAKTFSSVVASLVDEFGRKCDPAVYPFHLTWFDLKVEHSAIWDFIRDFPNTNREQEFASLTQTIREFVSFFEDVHHRYAELSSKIAGKGGSLLRFGLWQLMRDLELYKKSPTFNIQATLESANRDFNILCIDSNDPFEPVSVASLVQYLIYVTLHLNKHNDFVLSCAINQRSKIFGLFGTMLVIFVREFIGPAMSSPQNGVMAKLIQDDRTFATKFLSVFELNHRKLTIRTIFHIAELWKRGQAKDEFIGK